MAVTVRSGAPEVEVAVAIAVAAADDPQADVAAAAVEVVEAAGAAEEIDPFGWTNMDPLHEQIIGLLWKIYPAVSVGRI